MPSAISNVTNAVRTFFTGGETDNRTLTMHPPEKATSGDYTAVERLRVLSRLLRDEPERGKEQFQKIFGGEVDPGNPQGWSQESFQQLGLHQKQANPAYWGCPTLKLVAFLDVDNTQIGPGNWGPADALHRAALIIELAQKGYALVPVTGSQFSSGDPRFDIEARIANGQLFPTPFLIVDGGAKAYSMKGEGYVQSPRYQGLVERVINQQDRWEVVDRIFVEVAQEVIEGRIDSDWQSSPRAKTEFNEMHTSAGMTPPEGEGVPVVIAREFCSISQAPTSGQLGYDITLPRDLSNDPGDSNASAIVKEIDQQFQLRLKAEGIEGLSCFSGFQYLENANTEAIVRFYYGVGATSKELALRSFADVERAYGIPMDALNCKITVGGDGLNDTLFARNIESNVATSMPGRIDPTPPMFLIQPSRESDSLKEGVIKEGFPEEQILVLPKDQGGLIAQLRAGLMGKLGTEEDIANDTYTKVNHYLRSTEHKYQRGQDGYYLRRALKGALDSAREGNFGVGGVVLIVGEDHVLEFQSRNLMITGDPVMKIIGHAETGGLATIMKMLEDKHGKNILNKVKTRLRKGKEWSGEFGALGISAYSRNHNEDTATLRPGTHVFTTLEPCPMCTSVILNSKADFCLIGAEDAYGGAVLSGRLQKLTPAWVELAAETTFDLYQGDPLLQDLCWKIFEGTVNVNNKLLQRNLYDAIMSD